MIRQTRLVIEDAFRLKRRACVALPPLLLASCARPPMREARNVLADFPSSEREEFLRQIAALVEIVDLRRLPSVEHALGKSLRHVVRAPVPTGGTAVMHFAGPDDRRFSYTVVRTGESERFERSHIAFDSGLIRSHRIAKSELQAALGSAWRRTDRPATSPYLELVAFVRPIRNGRANIVGGSFSPDANGGVLNTLVVELDDQRQDMR